MQAGAIPARAVIFIVAVFLVLVFVHLRWGGDAGDGVSPEQGGPRVLRIQVKEQGQMVDLNGQGTPLDAGPTAFVDESTRQLGQGALNERRTAAVQLAYMANDPQEGPKLLALGTAFERRFRQALLAGLNDSDETVSRSSRQALVGWWRLSGNAALSGYVRQGVDAFEARRYEAALEAFRAAQSLGSPVPPDLHRMEAEVCLHESRFQEAKAAAQRALQAEPQHFLALHALAQACEGLGQREEALRAVRQALAIYHRFPEARELEAGLVGTGGS
jgi:tetratricopeptide (TPR) repeat protein